MWRSALLGASVAIIASGCAASSVTPPPSQGRHGAPPPASVTTADLSITLTGDQVSSIRGYYAGTRSANGRGRGHARGLPPGIARNLARGRALPPGIAKAYLPAHVVAGLPALPASLDYVIVAGKLLLVEAATQVVREILLDLAFDS